MTHARRTIASTAAAAAVVLLGNVPNYATQAQEFVGVGRSYTVDLTSGAATCLPVSIAHEHYAVVNNALFDAETVCGRCVHVSCLDANETHCRSNASEIAYVLDQCTDDCSQTDLGVSPDVYARLTNDSGLDNPVGIRWRFADCPVPTLPPSTLLRPTPSHAMTTPLSTGNHNSTHPATPVNDGSAGCIPDDADAGEDGVSHVGLSCNNSAPSSPPASTTRAPTPAAPTTKTPGSPSPSSPQQSTAAESFTSDTLVATPFAAPMTQLHAESSTNANTATQAITEHSPRQENSDAAMQTPRLTDSTVTISNKATSFSSTSEATTDNTPSTAKKSSRLRTNDEQFESSSTGDTDDSDPPNDQNQNTSSSGSNASSSDASSRETLLKNPFFMLCSSLLAVVGLFGSVIAYRAKQQRQHRHRAQRAAWRQHQVRVASAANRSVGSTFPGGRESMYVVSNTTRHGHATSSSSSNASSPTPYVVATPTATIGIL